MAFWKISWYNISVFPNLRVHLPCHLYMQVFTWFSHFYGKYLDKKNIVYPWIKNIIFKNKFAYLIVSIKMIWQHYKSAWKVKMHFFYNIAYIMKVKIWDIFTGGKSKQIYDNLSFYWHRYIRFVYHYQPCTCLSSSRYDWYEYLCVCFICLAVYLLWLYQ